MEESGEKLMEVLNDYYGDSRSPDHKEEIYDFIEERFYDIKEAMEGNISDVGKRTLNIEKQKS